MSVDYPLKQVWDIKKKRVDDAEKILKQKKELLSIEEEKLKTAQMAKDEAQKLYSEKLTGLRSLLDEGSTTNVIKRERDYLKEVKEKLAKEEEKVNAQQKKVDAAKIEVENAQKFLKEKEKEVEKIEIHHKEWMKEAMETIRKEEEKAQDEIGTAIFYGRKKITKDNP